MYTTPVQNTRSASRNTPPSPPRISRAVASLRANTYGTPTPRSLSFTALTPEQVARANPDYQYDTPVRVGSVLHAHVTVRRPNALRARAAQNLALPPPFVNGTPDSARSAVLRPQRLWSPVSVHNTPNPAPAHTVDGEDPEPLWASLPRRRRISWPDDLDEPDAELEPVMSEAEFNRQTAELDARSRGRSLFADYGV